MPLKSPKMEESNLNTTRQVQAEGRKRLGATRGEKKRGLGTNSQWPLNKAITPRATETYWSEQAGQGSPVLTTQSGSQNPLNGC